MPTCILNLWMQGMCPQAASSRSELDPVGEGMRRGFSQSCGTGMHRLAMHPLTSRCSTAASSVPVQNVIDAAAAANTTPWADVQRGSVALMHYRSPCAVQITMCNRDHYVQRDLKQIPSARPSTYAVCSTQAPNPDLALFIHMNVSCMQLAYTGRSLDQAEDLGLQPR
mmetsp:Transcript_5070/g.11017  ORF Transcript_5070/g.11017 Transcript_5070/m.11017 type:complete len:168 (-) Transcript_5070:784-1287(-)